MQIGFRATLARPKTSTAVNPTLEDQFQRYRQRGDVAALADVFDRTAPEVLRVAHHMVRDSAQAEELLQETFVAAIRSAEAYDASQRLVPWLLGILSNLARSAWRKNARVPDPARLRTRAEAAPASPEDVRDAVNGVLDEIPEPYRATLVLHLQHELSPVQIAHALNLPPATVRSHIHRGLKIVRRKLPPSTAPGVLAAMPLTLTTGLGAVREAVLVKAAALAAPTGIALVLGGLIVTKNAALAGCALICCLLFAGGAYWMLNDVDEDEASRAGAQLRRASGVEEGEEPSDAAPTLVSVGSAPRPALAPAKPMAPETLNAAAPQRVPLDTPIPEGKGSVAGTLHFEDGTPVVGVTVALWGESPVDDVTDAEGAFHLHGDWVGKRKLYVKGKRRFDAVILKAVPMKADALVQVALTIARGHEWRGTVHAAKDGAPIAGTLVTLRRPGSNSSNDLQAGYASHRTDEQGAFHFRFLPAASYTVELTEPGYTSVLGRVAIGPDTPEAAYRLKRSRPFLVTFEGLGAEAVGSKVSWSFHPVDPLGTHYSPSGKGTLEVGGQLRLDAPPPGTYRLLLFRSAHTDRIEREIIVGETQDEPLLIKRVETARIEATLRSAGGAPLSKTRLQVGSVGTPVTDEEGRFVLARVPPGSHMLWALFDTGWVALPNLEVESTGSQVVEVVMPGSAVVKGRVVGAGARAGNGNLLTVEGARRQVAMARPDGAGRFVMPHLPAGRYEFQWTQPGTSGARRVVDLVAGATIDLGDLEPAANPSVPLEVTVSRGEVRPRVLQMKLAYGSGANRGVAFMGTLNVDKNGRAYLTTLGPGTYTLVFEAAPFAAVEVSVTVVDGANETVSISLERK